MLTDFQLEVLRVIAPDRSESSFLSGSVPLNMANSRISADGDIFNDSQEVRNNSFKNDIKCLIKHGYDIKILKEAEQKGIGEAIISRGDSSFVIQWVSDSAWRFFPAEEDDDFGFVLNYYDLVTNKILALVGRDTVRDYYDVCRMLSDGEPVDAYIFAACGKDPTYTPDMLLSAISRASQLWREEDFQTIAGCSLDIRECKVLITNLINEATDRFAQLDESLAGCFMLDPDTLQPFLPVNGEKFILHEGCLHGSLPQIKNDPSNPPSP